MCTKVFVISAALLVLCMVATYTVNCQYGYEDNKNEEANNNNYNGGRARKYGKVQQPQPTYRPSTKYETVYKTERSTTTETETKKTTVTKTKTDTINLSIVFISTVRELVQAPYHPSEPAYKSPAAPQLPYGTAQRIKPTATEYGKDAIEWK